MRRYPRRPGRDRQPRLRLGGRRRGRDGRGLRARRRGRRAGHALPALAPGADGDVRRDRDYDKVGGKLTLWCTTQAPHAHRTLYALVPGRPEHKIRVISPDVGGGFGNKVPIYPGYVCAIVGSIVTGRPVKWMEDRSENLMSTGSRATTRCAAGSPPPAREAARRSRYRSSPTTARSTPPPSRRATRPASSACSPAPTTCRPRTAASPASTRTRRPAALRTRARSGSPRPCTSSSAWSTAWPTSWTMDPAELRLEEPPRARAVPVREQDRLGLRLGRLRARRCARRSTSPATTSCAASRRRSGSAAS